jgi:hypothetical protein
MREGMMAAENTKLSSSTARELRAQKVIAAANASVITLYPDTRIAYPPED